MVPVVNLTLHILEVLFVLQLKTDLLLHSVHDFLALCEVLTTNSVVQVWGGHYLVHLQEVLGLLKLNPHCTDFLSCFCQLMSDQFKCRSWNWLEQPFVFWFQNWLFNWNFLLLKLCKVTVEKFVFYFYDFGAWLQRWPLHRFHVLRKTRVSGVPRPNKKWVSTLINFGKFGFTVF